MLDLNTISTYLANECSSPLKLRMFGTTY